MGMTKPDVRSVENFESVITLGAGEKELTVNMPLYGNVYELQIGLRNGATVEKHSPYKYETPIVFYGRQ
jgi:hypothetical protein